MTTLEEKALELERRLTGEDHKTVHQLNLMLKALLVIIATTHEADELLEVIEMVDDSEGA